MKKIQFRRLLWLGVVCLLVGFSPWQPVFAIQQRFSPSPGAAAGVHILIAQCGWPG